MVLLFCFLINMLAQLVGLHGFVLLISVGVSLLPPICFADFSSDFASISLTDFSVSHGEGKKKAAIFVCDKIEELHVAAVLDVLKRAGMHVKICTLKKKMDEVLGTNVIMFYPDTTIEPAKEYVPYDVLIVPGGFGYSELSQNEDMKNILLKQQRKHGLIGAIGHGIYVLKKHSIGILREIARPPHEIMFQLRDVFRIQMEKSVVHDSGLLSCSNTADVIDFSLKIVEILYGEEKRKNVSYELKYGSQEDFSFPNQF